MLLDNWGINIKRFIRIYLTDDWFKKFIWSQMQDFNVKPSGTAPTFVITEDKIWKASSKRISGLIESVKIKDGDYWKVVSFTLFDPDDWTYNQLRMWLDRNSRTFLSCLWWADLTKPVSFNLYTDKAGYASVSMWQDWQMLKWSDDYNIAELYNSMADLKDKDREAKLNEIFEDLVGKVNAKEKAEMKVAPNAIMDEQPFSDAPKWEWATKASDSDLTDYSDSLPF